MHLQGIRSRDIHAAMQIRARELGLGDRPLAASIIQSWIHAKGMVPRACAVGLRCDDEAPVSCTLAPVPHCAAAS
jgi:hypothetical protein